MAEPLSNDELLALLNSGAPVQPVDATTGAPLPEAQAQTYRQLGAAGGIDPGAQPGSIRLPLAQRAPEDLPDAGQFYVSPEGLVRQAPESDLGTGLSRALGDRVRAFARGIPIAGSWSDEINAGIQAVTAPFVEPSMRGLEGLGVPTSYDEQMRITRPEDRGFGGGFFSGMGDRYDTALSLQRLRDAGFDEQNPGETAGLQLAGGVLGSVAGVLGAPLSGGAAVASKAPQFGVNVLAPLSARLSPEAGVIAKALAMGTEGAAIGAAHGAGLGEGDTRANEALVGALIGGGVGAGIPVAAKPLGAAWDATGGKALDAVRSVMSPFSRPGAISTTEDLARITGGSPGMPAALAQGPDRELQDLVASLRAAPAFPDVPPSAMDEALSRIGLAAQRQGQTPDDLVAAVAALGPRAVLADSGQAMRGLARDAMNRPSGAEDIIRGNLDVRQMGVREGGSFTARPASARIADAASEGIGMEGKTALSTFDALSKVQKEAADPLYAQVREIGATDSDKLVELSNRPSVKKALARAYNIAKEEGRNPEELALFSIDSPDAFVSSLPPEEQTVLQAQGALLRRGGNAKPSRGRTLADFISSGGGIVDDAGEIAAMDGQNWHVGKAFKRRLVGEGGSADDWALRAWEAGYFPQWESRPTTRQLYDALREEMRGKPRYARNAATELTDRLAAKDQAEEAIYRGGFDAPPSPDDYVGRPEPEIEMAYQATPTAETWDYVKRGLDDVLETYRNKTTGELVLNDEGRAILRTLQELRGELINLNPVYGEALDAYSGPAAMKDALEAGRGAFRETGESLERKFADFTAGEKEMYRLGAMQALREKLGNQDVTFNAAQRAGILKPAQLERFKELFPTERAFNDFVRTLDLEQTMFQTRSQILGNSTTAKQLLAAQEAAPSALETMADAGMSATTNGLAPMSLLRALNNLGKKKMSPQAAEAIAALTTGLDQARTRVALEEFYAVQRREALAKAIERSLGAQGAAAGVNAAASAGGK